MYVINICFFILFFLFFFIYIFYDLLLLCYGGVIFNMYIYIRVHTEVNNTNNRGESWRCNVNHLHRINVKGFTFVIR